MYVLPHTCAQWAEQLLCQGRRVGRTAESARSFRRVPGCREACFRSRVSHRIQQLSNLLKTARRQGTAGRSDRRHEPAMASFVSREFVSFVPPPTVPVGEGDHMLARPVIDALCTAFSGDSLPKLLETTKDIDLTNAAAALLLNLVMLELVNTENVSSLSQNCDEMAHLSTQAVQLICDRSAGAFRPIPGHQQPARTAIPCC